jgi:uncharacterized protein YhaN
MRLISLNLTAYGNFTDRRLVLPEGKGLHVIYGSNEVGKSTCIRALRGLLYGIPENTPDDFLHESRRLRVGAVLLRSDGERLSVVRRKGRKDTLLGPDGRPIAEDTLGSFLGGVDRETFIRVFGMSRDELLSGGRAIMEGKGSVGESLFAAGLGGADLKGLLETLESDAQSLFKPAGSLPKLNAEAKTYRELKARIRDLSLLPKEWEELEGEVSSLEAHARQIKDQIALMSAQEDRLKRLRDALPVIGELREYRRKRTDLGEVKVLREGFSTERTRCQSENTRALSDEKTAQQRIGEIDAELGNLILPEDLLAQEKTVQGLVEELGSILKAQKDLPRVQGQVLEAIQAAKGILAELRPDLSLECAGVLRLTVERIDKIRRLAEEHGRLTVRRQSAAERVSEYCQKLADGKRNLAELPEVRDVTELERSVVIVRRRGDLERAYAEAEFAAHSAREDVQATLKALPLWSGTLETLESLPLPPEKTIDEFEEAFDLVDDGLRRAREDLAGTKGKIEEIDGNLRTLKLVGEPPTEEDLTAARAHRERGWALVRSAWLEGKRDEAAEAALDPPLPLEQAYEKGVLNADNVADRMRREAERVAHKAGLLADRRLQEERAEDVSREIGLLKEKRKELEKEWTSRWAPAGVVPISPREIRAWMANLKELTRRAGEIRKLDGQAKKIAEEIEGSRSALLDRLAALGELPPPERSSLDAILLRAEEIIRSEKDLSVKRETLLKEIEEAIKGKARAEEEERKVNEAFARWQEGWATALKGISEGLPVSAAAVFLDRCAALSKKLDDAEKDKGRIESMKKDVQEFDKKVAKFIARYAPGLAGLAVDQAVREVSSRVSKGKADAASRAKLSSERASRKKDLDKARETIRQTSERLAALRREAGCENDGELPEAEARSESARFLDGKIDELSRRLMVLAAGRKLEEFAGEAEREDPDQIRQKLAEVETNLTEAQEEFGRVRQNLGASSERLRTMDGRGHAAQAAQEAQETLASLRETAEKYLRLRLGVKILQAEIERYREKSQGPVLRRAAELFALVTERCFIGLEPDYGVGDEPVLVGVRENGERVALAGMSDGTQDQLYLALRLASLEKFSADGEPLPLLVDDALVNFDNARARAALKVLGDLAARTQVIFFTHHQHMVHLAKESVDGQILYVQELNGTREEE